MTHATGKFIGNIQNSVGQNNQESKCNRCRTYVYSITKIYEVIVWIKEFIMQIVFMDG